MTISDRIVATIRTLVPSLYGIGIAWLIKQVPAVGDVIAWLSNELGTDITLLIQGVITAGIIAGFYWVARKLGDRWPWLEKWLLGSSLVPVYAPEVVTDVNTGDISLLTRAEFRAYIQALADDADANK